MRKRWKEVGLGLLTMLAAVLAVLGCQAVCRKYLPPNMGQLALAATFLVVYLAGARWIERRPVRELGPRRALPEIATGLALGFVLFSAVMAILWAMGVYHPTGLGTVALINGLAMAIASGILEELLFRGILFRLSSRIVGTWGALLFTSALFGLVHITNPGATWGSSVAIMLEAGVLLGAAYAVTGRLWLPIGMHMGWNFTEGSVFGMSVSGFSADSGLLRGSLTGPRLLTGGPFGPEASVVAVLLCLLLAVYLLYRTVKLGRIELPAWAPAPVAVAAVGAQFRGIVDGFERQANK